MQEFWNHRYNDPKYAYGTEPNEFFKSVVDQLQKGKILIPGVGEGRDAAYCAVNGWQTEGFDFSDSALEKAGQLLKRNRTKAKLWIEDAASFKADENSYDAIGLTFFHLSPEIRESFHHELIKALKPNGIVFMEAFRPEQLGMESGGPKDPSMLYTTEMLAADFKILDIEVNRGVETFLREGSYHFGEAKVVRFLARKKA
ncbi:MAG: class I SAM-dependent methyltransferase [Cyclobacteriaceae bacterium]|nr:class I SAM-dependent methyltransferase [Cyclobacteriaceae bacterium]MCH8516840.1 class I SAM-dependent methyltransferase [Cyclobacteriaceae bacterium]